MDPFSHSSFTGECDLLQITPEGYGQEMTAFQPDLLFVESAACSHRNGVLTSGLVVASRNGDNAVSRNREGNVNCYRSTSRLAQTIQHELSQ